MQLNELSSALIADQGRIAALAAWIRDLPQGSFIALDTEFIRVTTYYPVICLLQLAIDGRTFIVDAQNCDIRDLVLSLYHSRALILTFADGEDREIFVIYARAHDISPLLPERWLVIQLLIAFAGGPFSQGLANAVREKLGIEMDKSESRSDWTLRPLSSEQLEYARADVRHLEALYKKLRDELNDGRIEWCFAENQERHLTAMRDPIAPEQAYLEVSGAGRLNARDLGVLQFLCARRLEYARSQDKAPNLVITGSALCNLARSRPVDFNGLIRAGVKEGCARRMGQQILHWLRQGAELPHAVLQKPYDLASGDRITAYLRKAVKTYLTGRAKAVRICPVLLSNDRLIDNYLYARQFPQLTEARIHHGWYAQAADSAALDAYTAERRAQLEEQEAQRQAARQDSAQADGKTGRGGLGRQRHVDEPQR